MDLTARNGRIASLSFNRHLFHLTALHGRLSEWSLKLTNPASFCSALYPQRLMHEATNMRPICDIKSFSTKHLSTDKYVNETCYKQAIYIYFFSLFHRAFRFTKFYLYQRMHLF